MVERNDNRITTTSGMNTWRAGCGGSRTSGSEGGPQKPTHRKMDRALRPDPYTKLLGPAKWTYFYLYVIIDIYSRYVPGWMLARAENAGLAEALLADTVAKQGIEHGQLAIHADRGSPMTAKPVAHLLADLGVTKSHSRPHVSNDNPYSESQFRTLKYRPDFPERFGCEQDAAAHCRRFFDWYNHEHRHGALGLYTPFDVHRGLVAATIERRTAVLDAAYRAHPERFARGRPAPAQPPTEVWINKPMAMLPSDNAAQ